MTLVPGGWKPWIRFALVWCSLALAVIAAGRYMTSMPEGSYSGPFSPLSPEEEKIRLALERDVGALAGEIGERNLWNYDQLEAAARYIGRSFRESGYTVREQVYTVEGRDVRNIEAQLTGTSRAGEIIIVGAHYDSVHGSPGANDNATGTAAVMEMARLLAGKRFPRTVRFVAFVNEEPPFFLTQKMGSRVYARRARERGEAIRAMLSIETIGTYSDERGSQRYPFPFRFFYPDRADFIGFVGNLASRNLVRRTIGSFRSHTPFPSEGIAAPGWFIGVGWSDHWSFWREGYRAIMITDTALFRYAAYHTRGDMPEKIDYPRTARVVAGIARVVEELAQAH